MHNGYVYTGSPNCKDRCVGCNILLYLPLASEIPPALISFRGEDGSDSEHFCSREQQQYCPEKSVFEFLSVGPLCSSFHPFIGRPRLETVFSLLEVVYTGNCKRDLYSSIE
jgi:hypothetical protein